MNAAARDSVTLGADVGGEDADDATSEHVLAFRKLLQQECQGPYSDTVEEFALVLRIDGSVQTWGKSGVENVALQRRNTYATADIFVPKKAWSGGDSLVLRSVLATGVRDAMERIGKHAHREKVTVSIDTLIHDVDRAIEKFLGA